VTPQEMIRANAELVVGQLGPASGIEEFGYNAASVEWLDGFIERQRVRPEFADEAEVERITQTLGSFLGECVIKCYGGEWREREGSWAVDFGEGNSAFPFNKVRKQFANGESDGINSWFETIPLVFAPQLEALKTPPQKRPWWKLGR
jgi:hypothetical protein